MDPQHLHTAPAAPASAGTLGLRVTAGPHRTPQRHRRRITIEVQVGPGQCPQFLGPGPGQQGRRRRRAASPSWRRRRPRPAGPPGQPSVTSTAGPVAPSGGRRAARRCASRSREPAPAGSPGAGLSRSLLRVSLLSEPALLASQASTSSAVRSASRRRPRSGTRWVRARDLPVSPRVRVPASKPVLEPRLDRIGNRVAPLADRQAVLLIPDQLAVAVLAHLTTTAPWPARFASRVSSLIAAPQSRGVIRLFNLL